MRPRHGGIDGPLPARETHGLAVSPGEACRPDSEPLMTARSLVGCVLTAILALAGAARGQIIASAGFNDASGINSNPTPNSPYNVNNVLLDGQGAGEPGWFTPWQVSGARVVNAGAFEGDGAVFMQGTTQPVRVLAQPISGRTSVEVLTEIVNSAVTGNGINFYVRQASIVDTTGVGPQWQLRGNGHITVIDGNEDGDPNGIHVC